MLQGYKKHPPGFFPALYLVSQMATKIVDQTLVVLTEILPSHYREGMQQAYAPPI